MDCRVRPTMQRLRVVLAAVLASTLAACAGGIDQKPDKPFKTANACLGSAIPAGWIRTNDWRGKGCGIDEGAAPGKAAKGPRDDRAILQLASAAVPPPKAKAKPKKPVDISRGVNAVDESGPNNWMSLAELDRVRVGRFLTACAGAVPQGWVEKARYWDKGRCGNPAKSSEKNVMLIERVR